MSTKLVDRISEEQGVLVRFDAVLDRGMQGRICELLWDTVTQDQESLLTISKVPDVKNLGKLEVPVRGITIYCDRSTYSNCIFDRHLNLIECPQLDGGEWVISFRHVRDFVVAAKKVVLHDKRGKDGIFTMDSVVNQCILNNVPIDIKKLGD